MTDKKLIVVVGDNCPQCVSAKKRLDNSKILYSTKRVFDDMEFSVKHGIRSVPSFIVESEGGVKVFHGSAKLDEALEELGG